jgi:hypothetical protein
MATTSANPNELLIKRIPLFHRGNFASKEYSYQTFGVLTFRTLAFQDSESDEFAQLFNHEMISGQSVVSVSLPHGQEFYLTGGFTNRPFIAGVFGDLIVAQVREKVYCLSISRELEIEHTFTLSKQLRFYHNASCDGDILEIYYHPANNNPENPNDVYSTPNKEVFHLIKW